MTRADLLISGRVQGVFYRASAQQEAMRLGLAGEIRNLPDGRVEAVLQGLKEDVEGMIKWCYRGPSEARVSNIDVAYEEAKDDLEIFGIR